MAITNIVGPPVTGDDFYGRTKELVEAHKFLDTYHSLALSAPRRIGKSSFAKRLIFDKKSKGWNCVYIDLEGVRTKDEFLQILINQFEKSGIWTDAITVAGSFINRVFEGIKGIGPLEVDFSSPETTKTLYTSLSEVIDHTKDTLIVIDELTLFLNVLDRNDDKNQEVEFFLNWFRSLRQVTNSKIRWIFCGSVGLHNFTRLRNLSMTINDLVPFDFDELSYEEAYGLINALANSEQIPISARMIGYLLDKIEWNIPYFIQLLFTNIKNNKDIKNGISEKIIEDAFDKLAHSKNLSTWSERLSEYRSEERGARLLLKELCKSENGLSRDQLLTVYARYLDESPINADDKLSQILNMIEHDGYIMRGKGGIRRFRSPLLKKWWFYNFVE